MENTKSPSPEQKSANRTIRRGCGCVLLIIGVLLALFAIFIGVGSCTADNKAGEKNEAEWAEYNANMPIIDSLYEAGVPDSIIDARYPQPIIRQGGFATIFGGLIAFIILIVAAIAIIIGVILTRKKQRKLTSQNEKDEYHRRA